MRFVIREEMERLLRVLRKIITGLFLITVLISLFGCDSAGKKQIVQLPDNSNIILPSPDKVVLSRVDQAGKQLTVTLKQGDLGSMLNILRVSVQTSLQPAGKVDWQTSKHFSLELDYTKSTEVDLIVKHKRVQLMSKRLLFDLDKRILLIDQGSSIKAYSGIHITDSFTQFMKNFTANSVFPLPPATPSGLQVEQLPLAKPGEAQIELLPPSTPPGQQQNH